MQSLLVKYKNIPAPVKASLWFLVCSFLQSAISTITTPIFTRILNTSEYGDFNVFASWQSIVTIFVGLNIYSAVYTQGLVKFENDKKVYSSSMQGLLFSLCVFWSIVYFSFQGFWNKLFSLSTIQMVSMIGMIWATSVFNLWAAEQRTDFKYKGLVVLTVVFSILKPTVSIILVLLSKDKVTARIVGLLIVELICFSWIFLYELKRGLTFCSKKYWIYTISLSLPLVPHYLSQTVLSSADRIMIKDMVGSSQAGIYSLAYSISQIMTLFGTAMIQTINPWIFRKIKNKEIKDIGSVAYTALIIIAFLNLALIAFAPEIVKIFASEKYYTAIWVMPPVAMSVYFMFAYSLFAAFEFYYEKTKYISLATILSASLNVLLNFVFINLFGYKAAGYTTLVCYILYTAFHYVCMERIINKHVDSVHPYNLKKIGLISIVFLFTGFVFLFLYSNDILRYFFIAILLFVALFKRKWFIDNVLMIKNLKKSK